jgi:hypothetical protein
MNPYILHSWISLDFKAAWETPYVGNSHELLLKVIQSVHAERFPEWYQSPSGVDDMSFMSIIQGASSGKSRTVDEVAKKIFTIPLDLKYVEDTQRRFL